MTPTCKPGDFIVILRHFFRININDVVVIQHEHLGMLIKRVASVDSQGVMLKGDDARSISSDKIGKVARQHIMGKLLFRIAKKQ